MTEVAFHFNAPDKLAYACRFARKALKHGARVVVTGGAAELQALDRMMWALGPTDFVAHALADADPDVVAASPVLLAVQPLSVAMRDVLLNLGSQLPSGFEQFEKVIEVVSASDEQDRQSARTRWRQYAAQGYEIVRHDLVLKENA
ncbi:DNA polymerase III subunit chi [Diaphorobacter aerolatus]|uniref:DNA polymerase III subunit chi n=1 Tax=Diaphorobacter aerolatus TaxID=1288495 RepID=A0A7H0GKL1_9BURK|nr:DNA polymerase III subunit chi [Diaphorobacter aerolatus]QNP48827.1 DNA polymerase III subunit chi [Diaphorobacter aerolatus]